MTYDPLAPAINTPPRQVEAWTNVPGHNVGRTRAFCSCGASAPTDSRETPAEWRDSHLRDAWPVVVPRVEGEALEGWLARISDEFVSASRKVDRLSTEAGLDQPLRDGAPIPVITPEMSDAGELVDVLQHQLDDVRETLSRRSGWED